jgi:hypothetical protein
MPHLIIPGACTPRIGALVAREDIDENTSVLVQVRGAKTWVGRHAASNGHLLHRATVESRGRAKAAARSVRGGSRGKGNDDEAGEHGW